MVEFGVPGFFGKLPSRGDFVTRRLPRDFIDVWDAWLQDAIAAGQARLGGQWLDVYLTSPVWSFVLSPGVCGESAYAGILIPSVDKVGRYFPLMAATSCGGKVVSTFAVRRHLASWYERAQELLLATLEEPGLDLDEFDERLAGLRPEPSAVQLDWAVPVSGAGHTAWHFVVPDRGNADPLSSAILSDLLARDLGAHSIWWTAGSERVAPSTLIVAGLPPAHAFAAMLDGDFSGDVWLRGALRLAGGDDEPIRFRSAAVTDKGKVRAVNEDSFASRDDIGVWLVADGLGGHQAGDVASGMVACVLEQFASESTVERAAERLAQGLRVVNACLRVLAERNPGVSMAASTVAALIARGSKIALVWAGDSRVYRLRDGDVRLLTRDHADAEADGPTALVPGEEPANRAVTRAVGGAAELDLDIIYDGARPLDRYLLCTDGLYGALSEDDIVRALSADDAEKGGAELARLVLEGPAADNLTGVIVHSMPSGCELGGNGASGSDG